MPECLECEKDYVAQPGDKVAVYGLCKKCRKLSSFVGIRGIRKKCPGEDEQSRKNAWNNRPLGIGIDGKYIHGKWHRDDE